MTDHSSWTEEDTATNGIATATRAGSAGNSCHYINSVSGSFGATASGITLELKEGSTTLMTWHVYDSFALSFDKPIRLQPGAVANLVLAAGGSGIVGFANMSGYTA